MQLPDLMHQLTTGGFTLALVGCNDIEVKGPTHRLTPELKGSLRHHKPALLANSMLPVIFLFLFRDQFLLKRQEGRLWERSRFIIVTLDKIPDQIGIVFVFGFGGSGASLHEPVVEKNLCQLGGGTKPARHTGGPQRQ